MNACDCRDVAYGMWLFGVLYGASIPVGLYALWWVSRYGRSWPQLFGNLKRVMHGDRPVRG